MPAHNTQSRYGSVTKSFHWLTALLILTLIPLGWYASQLPHETSQQLATKAWLFSLHKTLGVALFFVALARILWSLTQTSPGLLNAERPVEAFTARLVHWLLYGALVIVPLSGWISHAAAAGFAPIWWPFGQSLPMVPKSTQVEHFFASIHWVSGRLLIVAVLFHVAGALKHHVIDKDSTLRRMLPGHSAQPRPAQHPKGHAPVLTALVIWGAALGFAALPDAKPEPTATAPLAQTRTGWTVTEGTIDITVTQFGSDVPGSFADWTAAIFFDETAPGLTVGHVTTTISIPSLTLGSVTQQAMGPDFFDAATHATAVFDADLNRGNDGFVAVGRLRIKDNTVPLSLPFHLVIDGDTAKTQLNFTLDRRDFGIGDNLGDEQSLAFAVKVRVSLTAQRSGQE